MTDPTLAAERLQAFAQEYAERHGPDPAPIYGIWPGTDTPVILTVDDLLAVTAEVIRLRRTVADLRTALRGIGTNALKIAAEVEI